MFSIQIKGLRELRQNLERILKERPKRIENGLTKSARKIFDKSREIVPVAKGNLKRSGRISEIEVSNDSTYHIQVIYGNDADAKHATYVHEVPHRLDRNKYLERPTMDYVKDFAKDMAEETGFD